MAALIRCGVFNSKITARSVFGSKRSTLSSPLQHEITTLSHRLFVTGVNAKDRLLDDVHRKIDYNQGISTQLYTSLSSTLEGQGSLLEQDVGLMLHICSSGPFDSPTDKRLEFVEDVWSKLEKHGISPSIKLYNIKLKAYCKNKKDFNALDELMKIKSLGLNPDKVTYSLLIEGFCLKGDIEGANSVLEAMKTAQLAINVTIFNSFITGHLKAGSPQEAAQVLELISSSGLNPNAHTYFKFASFYAEEGDIDSVEKYMNEAEEAGFPLDHSMLLDLYRTMVTSGHSAVAGKLIQAISEKGIFSSSFMQKSCHLVADGFLDAAVELYTMMPKAEEGKIVSNSGNFLLKSMVINGHSAQDIFNMADKIVEISPRSLAHRNALLFTHRAEETDKAMEMLELMIAKNHSIKVPYVIPAICSYRKQKNSEGVYKATGMLLNIPAAGIRDDRLDQLVRCSYPALVHCGQSREDIVGRLKEYEKLWNSIFFLEDLQTLGFDTALKNAEGKALDGAPFQWTDGPNSFVKFLSQETVASCVQAMDLVHQQKAVDQESFNYLSSRVVRAVINQRDWTLLEQLLDGFLEKNLTLVQSLKQVFLLSEAPESVREKLNKLCVGSGGGQQRQQMQRKGGQFLSLPQLEAMTEEDVRSYMKRNPDRFLPRLVLLTKAMSADDLPAIQQILRELQAMGFTLTLVQIMKVITKLTQLKDTEMALVYFEELKKLTGQSYKDSIPLMIGEELMKQGNVEGALEMIRAAKESQFPAEPKSKFVKRSILISMLENTPTPEDATRVHSAMLLSEPLLTDNDATALHAAYIRRIATAEDDDELVNTLLNVYQSYRAFPLHDFVLERLIKKKDVGNLKKVMDLGNAAFGNNFFHHKLALSFIRCGMPARGATILQTPGLRLNERLINANCQYLIKENQMEALESLVSVLREMPISQTSLLRHLVEGYVSGGNLKQATEAVQQFAVDVTQPPKTTVEFLIKAYRSSTEEVPKVLQSMISKPDQNSQSQPEGDTSSSSSSSDSDSEKPANKASDDSEPTDSASKS